LVFLFLFFNASVFFSYFKNVSNIPNRKYLFLRKKRQNVWETTFP